ncbi:hypothetical protein BJX68DRAFT_137441 [Aspergillus pseudodeflectus]|uniref:Uncharacterized protein n=1 Tax=Aspergillus pseudodeflectus TaxID=176178 RepID=A0ABR4JXV2_9EURO
MYAFHSARIISRLGQAPMGSMPQSELVVRLGACAEALEEQAAIFPTATILRNGIVDLVNDAQRQQDEPYSGSSIWEEEENENIQRERESEIARSNGGRQQPGRREIYSKHSVADVIRNIHFEAGDGKDDHQSSGHNTTIEVDGSDPADERERLSVQSAQYEQQRRSIVPGVFEPHSRDFTGYSGDTAGYNQGFSGLGFDPRYDPGQPDLFMDSFWPLICQDWTVPDVNGAI